MPAVASVVLGLLIGRVAGGRFSPIKGMQVPAPGALILLVVVQAAARGRLPGFDGSPVSTWLWTSVSVVAIAFVLSDIDRVPGLRLVVAGWLLNLLVVSLNQGMPVAAGIQASNEFYKEVTQNTALPLLGDILAAPGGWLLSIGDVLSLVGLTTGISEAMQPRRTAS